MDFEGHAITKSDLINQWKTTMNFYNEMIELGHPLRPMRFLIKHIIKNGYDTLFYPGTSLFNLLISLPLENKINYSKTLRIECDPFNKVVLFEYRDYSGLDRSVISDSVKALKWSEQCQYTEVTDFFEHFLAIFPEWLTCSK